jgi:FAD synthase
MTGKLQVDIYYRMRDEVKFGSVAELKAQLEEDMKLSLDYIKNKLT